MVRSCNSTPKFIDEDKDWQGLTAAGEGSCITYRMIYAEFVPSNHLGAIKKYFQSYPYADSSF